MRTPVGTRERVGMNEMSVITVDGQIGAGAPELGRRVARMFDFDYVDRLALPRGATSVILKTLRHLT